MRQSIRQPSRSLKQFRVPRKMQERKQTRVVKQREATRHHHEANMTENISRSRKTSRDTTSNPGGRPARQWRHPRQRRGHSASRLPVHQNFCPYNFRSGLVYPSWSREFSRTRSSITSLFAEGSPSGSLPPRV